MWYLGNCYVAQALKGINSEHIVSDRLCSSCYENGYLIVSLLHSIIYYYIEPVMHVIKA